MHGCREDFCSLVSRCARYSEHLDSALSADYQHELRTALRSMTQPLVKPPDTKLSFPGMRLLIRSRRVISSKRVGFRVNPTRRLPTQDRSMVQRIRIAISRPVRISTTMTDLLIQYGEYHDFQSLFDLVLIDRASHLSSGVCDILITGKVSYVVAVRMFAHPFLDTDRRAVRRRLGSFHNIWTGETLGWPGRSLAFSRTYLLCLFLSLSIRYIIYRVLVDWPCPRIPGKMDIQGLSTWSELCRSLARNINPNKHHWLRRRLCGVQNGQLRRPGKITVQHYIILPFHRSIFSSSFQAFLRPFHSISFMYPYCISLLPVLLPSYHANVSLFLVQISHQNLSLDVYMVQPPFYTILVAAQRCV